MLPVWTPVASLGEGLHVPRLLGERMVETMKGHWYFEYQGKPREASAIQYGLVHYRNLGAPRPDPFRMPMERWQELPPVEVECPEDGWAALVATDCCGEPRPECETATEYDINDSPLVTVCRRGHGCDEDG